MAHLEIPKIHGQHPWPLFYPWHAQPKHLPPQKRVSFWRVSPLSWPPHGGSIPVCKWLRIMVRKFNNYGCGTPSKWPNFMASKWGLLTTLLAGMILQAVLFNDLTRGGLGKWIWSNWRVSSVCDECSHGGCVIQQTEVDDHTKPAVCECQNSTTDSYLWYIP